MMRNEGIYRQGTEEVIGQSELFPLVNLIITRNIIMVFQIDTLSTLSPLLETMHQGKSFVHNLVYVHFDKPLFLIDCNLIRPEKLFLNYSQTVLCLKKLVV